MTSNTLHKAVRRHPHKAQPTQKYPVNVTVSEAAWQALQQMSLHFGTALSDTIETLAIDAALRRRVEECPENGCETGEHC